MAKFEGNVEAFRYTPDSDITENTVVVVGGLVGVTRDKCAANDTIMVFMTGKKSIYSLPLATSPATGTINRGAAVCLDSNGKIKASSSGDTVVGYLWEAVASGDTEATVLLKDFSVTTPGIATTTTAGLVKPDGTTITVTDAGVIATAG